MPTVYMPLPRASRCLSTSTKSPLARGGGIEWWPVQLVIFCFHMAILLCCPNYRWWRYEVWHMDDCYLMIVITRSQRFGLIWMRTSRSGHTLPLFSCRAMSRTLSRLGPSSVTSLAVVSVCYFSSYIHFVIRSSRDPVVKVHPASLGSTLIHWWKQEGHPAEISPVCQWKLRVRESLTLKLDEIWT